MKAPPPAGRHSDALDGVRGVAILLVFVFHVFWGSVQPQTSIGWKLHDLITMGWTGVDLFFVLSGYLITRSLWSGRSASNYYGVFYGRRMLRIFPLYYLVVGSVLAAGVVHHRGYGAGTQVLFWLNLSNLVTAFNPAAIKSLGHLWSLGIEEQFYLLWPTVIRNVRETRLAVVCLSIIGFCFL